MLQVDPELRQLLSCQVPLQRSMALLGLFHDGAQLRFGRRRVAGLEVGLSQAQPYIRGARLTGAGFGGATVHLVQSDALESFQQDVVAAYAAQSGRTPSVYVTEAVDGVSVL